METYTSTLTNESYKGEVGICFNEDRNTTEFYIGDSLVLSICGLLDSEEANSWFDEYFVKNN